MLTTKQSFPLNGLLFILSKELQRLPSNKATAVEIPIKSLKESELTFEYLTSCVKKAISSGKFTDSFNLSNIVPFHKKKNDKCNYRPVSIWPLLSKVLGKIIYDQLYIYMNNFLNELLGGFCKVHSIKNAPFKLLQALQNELDSFGIDQNYTDGSVQSI